MLTTETIPDTVTHISLAVEYERIYPPMIRVSIVGDELITHYATLYLEVVNDCGGIIKSGEYAQVMIQVATYSHRLLF